MLRTLVVKTSEVFLVESPGSFNRHRLAWKTAKRHSNFGSLNITPLDFEQVPQIAPAQDSGVVFLKRF